MSFLLPPLPEEGRGQARGCYFTRVYNPGVDEPDGMSWIEDA